MLVTYVIGQMKGVGVAFSRLLKPTMKRELGMFMFIMFFYVVA